MAWLAFRILCAVGVLARFAFCLSTPATNSDGRRVALITGANKGIGKEVARRLGSVPDLTTIIGARDASLGSSAVDDLRSDGCDVIFCQVDLDDEESIRDAAKFIRRKFGKLDVLVNNAAVCFNDPTLYGKVSHTPFVEQASITMKTNFFGTLAVTQSMMPLLLESPSPRIVNVASAAGRLSILGSPELVEAFTSDKLSVPELEELMNSFVSDVENGIHSQRGWPNTCYGVSKLGIIALTRVLARKFPQMMVNSADPGYCKTDQNNNQGVVDPARGAFTPFLLATYPEEKQPISGAHFYQEKEMPWSYQ